MIFILASSAAASWPGADKDPHPCLYVTAQDVAKARAALSKAELDALAKMTFADHFDGTGNPDDLVFAALVAGLVRNWGGKQTEVKAGPCDVAPGWEDGDRELRMIRWDGPQYPSFPDE